LPFKFRVNSKSSTKHTYSVMQGSILLVWSWSHRMCYRSYIQHKWHR